MDEVKLKTKNDKLKDEDATLEVHDLKVDADIINIGIYLTEHGYFK